MRVPLSWLREFVEVDLEPERLAERLTLLGMEVQGIERRGEDWREVVVGELLEVAPHPRADRLSLTRVTVGSGAPLEIVCGATNIAPGQRVPVALPGAVLPGGRRIERTEKMGVVSQGMLCSGDELGLTADADGILILPEGTQLGVAMTSLYGDVVFDIDVKPNRGDALSVLGLAREVGAITGSPVREPVIELLEAGRPTAERLSVEVRDPELCPRFVGRWVDGASVRPSPLEVQVRLLAAGQRPISNVVDASNYVMLELGKPIHTFDAAAVHGGRIVVRRATAGERFETLDHVERELTEDTLLIADPEGPIGIAGVMGGVASEISDTTRDVVVESAIFDPVSIRRTAFRYALRSEASLRFEKGQEFRLARIGADRTAQLVAAWSGGTVAPGRVDSNPNEPERRRVAFRPARLERLIGLEIPPAEQSAVLARVGIESGAAAPGTPITVAEGPDPLVVTAASGETVLEALVPTWRRDVAIEADVAEEVARVHGYDRVPGTLPDTTLPPYRPSPLEARDAVREALVGAGLTEAVTYALVSAERLAATRWTGADPEVEGEGAAGGEPISVTNPLSQDHAWLRQSVVGSLLDVTATNARRGHVDCAFFEVGKGYGRRNGEPHEWWRLGIVLTGSATEASWNQPARLVDLDDAKGVIELLCRRLGFPEPRYSPLSAERLLHPGRAATATVTTSDGRVALSGRVGELHPDVHESWPLRVERCVVAELAIRGLGGGQLADARGASPSRQPAVTRDLAVVVGDSTTAAAALATIRGAAGPALEDARLFDLYRGAPLAPDERSLAFRLIFRAPDRTLTEDEVDGAVDSVVARLERDLRAHIRS
ncbi:MAG: phenylalanine--tRNA ligase subunit beta [Chloroflexi bacterium]|nr:phenylalanine--tRNA ligase subunit beta [Chloroflexota bacterium]